MRNDLPNVILITLDAFNYELFIENIEILPNLKELKEHSVFFENAFSIGPSTFFSFPGIMASVYPYHFGIGIDRNVEAIDGVLKDCGYNTAPGTRQYRLRQEFPRPAYNHREATRICQSQQAPYRY